MEKIFRVWFNDEDQGECSESLLRECNLEAAPDFCDWMTRAKVGDEHREGGGASPLAVTVRVR